jgi:hypothetical protein
VTSGQGGIDFSLSGEKLTAELAVAVGTEVETKPEGKAIRRKPASSTESRHREVYDTIMASCREEAGKLVEFEGNSLRQLYGFLDKVASVVSDERFEGKSFAKYCRKKKITLTVATLRNPYLAVIRAVGTGIEPKTASKYGQALSWAAKYRTENKTVANVIAENGGVEGCVRKFRSENSAKPPTARTRRRPRDLPFVGLPAGLIGRVKLEVEIASEGVTFLAVVTESDEAASGEDTAINPQPPELAGDPDKPPAVPSLVKDGGGAGTTGPIVADTVES